MYIKNKKINIKNKPFIIAEISGNHKGSLKRALQIIKKAHTAGVSAIKLQTFDLDEMTIDSKNRDFIVNDKKSLWYKKKLYDLYKIAQTPKKWHYPIFNLCKKLNTSGIKCMKDGRTITCPDSIQPSGGSSGTGSGSAATSTGYTTHNNRACNPSGEIIQNESHTTYNSAKQACNTMSGCQGVQRFGGVYQLKSTVTGHKSNENHAYTCYKKN